MRVFYIILFFSIAFINETFSQCNSSLKLEKVIKADKETHLGSIIVSIKTDKNFTVELIAIKSGNRQVIKEQSGNNSEIIEFKNLSDEYHYRVFVKFDEDNFLCSNKLLDVTLNEDKQL